MNICEFNNNNNNKLQAAGRDNMPPPSPPSVAPKHLAPPSRPRLQTATQQ